jgi:hypothetical protein
MLASSTRPRLAAALPVLLLAGALAIAGCKQDIGERCEQNSDCASGVCGEGGPPGMTSAMGKKCVASLTPPPPQVDAMQNQSDAGEGVDVASSDASEASSSDAREATSSDLSGAGAETGGPETSSSDGASEAHEASTEAGAGG